MADSADTGGHLSGATLKTFGVIGTNRYVRLILESTNYDVEVNYQVLVSAGVEVAPGAS